MDREKELPELLTVKELAEIFKVEVTSVYTYVQQGIPVFSKKPLRFIESQCRDWIAER